MPYETRRATIERNRRWSQFADAVYAITTLLVAMRSKQLTQVVLDADRFTMTNCSWATYAIRDLVKVLAADELQRRKRVKSEHKTNGRKK